MRLLVCFLLITATTAAQQVTLKGLVSIHNSKYNTGKIEYVPDAYITAPFTKPVNSDVVGNFSLEFVGIDPGTAVTLTVEKSGLEVVNSYDLDKVIIQRNDPINIYLATKGQLAAAQTELYNISRKALFARKDALIAKLQNDDKEVLKELEAFFGYEVVDKYQAVSGVIERIDALEKRLPEFAQKLARQNLDVASDLYIEAYEYFLQGEIEKVIGVLDEQTLQASYQTAINDRKKSQALDAAAKKLEQSAIDEFYQILESYELKANAYYLIFDYKNAIANFQAMERIYKEQNLDPLGHAKVLDELATSYYQDGRFQLAEDKQKEAIELKNSISNLNPYERLYSSNMMALILVELDQKTEALQFTKDNITQAEQLLAADDPELGAVYDNAALIYSNNAEYEKAKELRLKAIANKEKNLAPDAILLAYSYDGLGNVYRSMGEYQKAYEYIDRAMTIRTGQLEYDHPSLITGYYSLAGILKDLGDYQSANEQLDLAIAIASKALDPLHPDIARLYAERSDIFMQTSNWQQALENSLKSLEIRKKSLPENHASIYSSMGNLSRIYSELGDLQKALEYQLEVLEYRKRRYGDDHINVATSYYTLGIIYAKLEQFKIAKDYQQLGLDIRRNKFPDNHATISNSLYRLALLEQALNNNRKALKLFEEVASRNLASRGDAHPYVVEDYINVAKVSIALNDFEKARSAYDTANGIYQKIPEFPG